MDGKIELVHSDLCPSIDSPFAPSGDGDEGAADGCSGALLRGRSPATEDRARLDLRQRGKAPVRAGGGGWADRAHA